MTWTAAAKPPGMKILDFLRAEGDYEGDDGRFRRRLLDCAVVGFTEAYLAYEVVDVRRQDRVVVAIPCRIRYVRSPSANFRFEDVHEDEDPDVRRCPPRILSLLTPTEHPGAIAWRAKCQARIDAKRR